MNKQLFLIKTNSKCYQNYCLKNVLSYFLLIIINYLYRKISPLSDICYSLINQNILHGEKHKALDINTTVALRVERVGRELRGWRSEPQLLHVQVSLSKRHQTHNCSPAYSCTLLRVTNVNPWVKNAM